MKEQLLSRRLLTISAILVAVSLLVLYSQLFSAIVLPPRLQDTITLSLGVLYEALPFVILGVLLSVTIQKYVSSDVLLSMLPKRGWLRRPVLSMFGMFLPVCECGNVPLARGLIMKGLKGGDVLTFLLAAPILNPVTILTTTQAFAGNNTIVLARVISAFFIAMLVGWLFSKTTNASMLTPSFQSYCEQHSHNQKKKRSLMGELVDFSHRFAEEIERLLPALAAGSIIAGIIQTSIPRDILTALAEQPVLSIVALIVLAFIVSICANVDAFFALSLSGIFSQGAIVAFLVFGPMIDIKMLALLKTTFKTWVLVILTTLVFFCSLLAGLVVTYAF